MNKGLNKSNFYFMYYILTSIIFGLVIWFLPFWPLRLVLGIISIALIASIFHKKRVFFIIVTSLIFLSLWSTKAVPDYVMKNYPLFTENLNNLFNNMNNFGEWNSYSNSIMPADTETKLYSKSLNIDVEKCVKIKVVDGNILRYPSSLDFSQDRDIARLSSNRSISNNYEIIVGRDNLKNLDITSSGVDLKGNMKLNSLSIDATGINVEGDIYANLIDINGTGINVNGDFTAEKITIDGTGININVGISCNEIKIDGTAMNIDFNVKKANKIEIDGTYINGKSTFFDEAITKVRIDGTSGIFKIIGGKNIDIDSSGVIIKKE